MFDHLKALRRMLKPVFAFIAISGSLLIAIALISLELNWGEEAISIVSFFIALMGLMSLVPFINGYGAELENIRKNHQEGG